MTVEADGFHGGRFDGGGSFIVASGRFLASFRDPLEVALMPTANADGVIDAIAEGTQVAKSDVKSVIEYMAIVGYKELNESGEFVIPGFAKMSVVHKPATEARSGVNPFTKEPMEFAAKPASKSVKASPLKVAKDAV